MQATITQGFIEGIPPEIRQRLNLRAGTVMEFDEETPYLKAVPAMAGDTGDYKQFQDWLTNSTGMAAGKLTTDARMKETRGEE